ncbi:hypothetical protein Q7P37_007115 [Cladosporium fusiforme]
MIPSSPVSPPVAPWMVVDAVAARSKVAGIMLAAREARRFPPAVVAGVSRRHDAIKDCRKNSPRTSKSIFYEEQPTPRTRDAPSQRRFVAIHDGGAPALACGISTTTHPVPSKSKTEHACMMVSNLYVSDRQYMVHSLCCTGGTNLAAAAAAAAAAVAQWNTRFHLLTYSPGNGFDTRGVQTPSINAVHQSLLTRSPLSTAQKRPPSYLLSSQAHGGSASEWQNQHQLTTPSRFRNTVSHALVPAAADSMATNTSPPMNGLDRDGLLTNEIHPLFADEQFHGNHDLSEILLARRFASRLLERPELMPWFYNMFFGRKTQIFEFDSTRNPQWKLPEPPTSLTAQQIADTKGRLLALQKCFYFEIDSSLPEHNARTHALPNEPAPEPFTGVKSKICISPLDIHELAASDLLAEVMASFLLGDLFHHELSHAVKLAVHGVSTQIFVGDGKVAEEGFEWESRMFGGNLCSYVAGGKYLVDGEQSPLSLQLLLKEWPSEELVNHYISTGLPIGLLRPPGYTCFWKVPLCAWQPYSQWCEVNFSYHGR